MTTTIDAVPTRPQTTSRSRANVWIAAVVVFLGSLLTFGVSAFFDPEPHHDGVQIVPAIAVSEGLWIHRDVFDQYGPITAWIQGAAVRVFGPYLLTIRLTTAVMLAVSAVLLLLVAREVFRSLAIPVVLTVLWIALWPGRSVEAITYLFLPWPSITFLMLQLAVALMVIRMVRGAKAGAFAYLVLGALTGIAVLTRLNYGLPLALGVVIALFFFGGREHPVDVKRWISLAAGFAAPIAVVVLLMAWQSALSAYVSQTIGGPLAGNATDGATPWFFYKNVLLWGSLPLFATLVVVSLWARVRPNARLVPMVLGVVGVLGLTAWVSTSIVDSALRNVILNHLTWAPALDHQAFQPLFLAAVVTPFACLALVVVCLRAVTVRSASADAGSRLGRRLDVLRGSSTRFRVTAVLIVLAGSSMAQLIPFVDPNHLWWAAPLILVLFAYLLVWDLSVRWRVAVMALLCLPPLIIAVPRAYQYVSQPRVRLQDGVVSGMYIPAERLDDVRLVDKTLLSLPPRSNRFDCWNGIFAAWNGTYLADSAGFVNWAFGVTEPSNAIPESTTVICAPVSADGSVGQFTVPPGMHVEGITGPVSLSYYNNMYLVTVKPGPA